MSVHMFTQWITDTCTFYAYVIYKPLQTYRQPYKQTKTDVVLYRGFLLLD